MERSGGRATGTPGEGLGTGRRNPLPSSLHQRHSTGSDVWPGFQWMAAGQGYLQPWVRDRFSEFDFPRPSVPYKLVNPFIPRGNASSLRFPCFPLIEWVFVQRSLPPSVAVRSKAQPTNGSLCLVPKDLTQQGGVGRPPCYSSRKSLLHLDTVEAGVSLPSQEGHRWRAGGWGAGEKIHAQRRGSECRLWSQADWWEAGLHHLEGVWPMTIYWWLCLRCLICKMGIMRALDYLVELL